MNTPLSTPLHPAFEDRMKGQLSTSFPDFIATLASPAPVSIQLHAQKTLPSSATNFLESVPWCSFGKYLSPRPIFTLDPTFHAGAYYVQEASSMLIEPAVRQAIGAIQQPLVLDLCAAPGGKSTLLLSIMNGRGLLTSNETIQSRVPSLEHNLTKWGYSNQIITSVDPERFEKLPGFFDLILIDAPCSGEGLFRKDPSSRKQWTPDIAHQCTMRQHRILHHAVKAIKSGGYLIYSTCTYNPQENIAQLKQLSSKGFESLSIPGIEAHQNIIKIEENNSIGYQVYPQLSKGEGFFIGLMQNGNKKSNIPLGSRSIDWASTPAGALPYSELRDQNCFFQNSNFHIISAGHEKNLEVLSHGLRIIRAGIPIGQSKYNEFVPDHALSQSLNLHYDCPKINFDMNTAIQYLKKESIPNLEERRGYHLVTFDGLGLGWVKAISGRLNNLYPQKYRIRSNFD